MRKPASGASGCALCSAMGADATCALAHRSPRHHPRAGVSEAAQRCLGSRRLVSVVAEEPSHGRFGGVHEAALDRVAAWSACAGRRGRRARGRLPGRRDGLHASTLAVTAWSFATVGRRLVDRGAPRGRTAGHETVQLRHEPFDLESGVVDARLGGLSRRFEGLHRHHSSSGQGLRGPWVSTVGPDSLSRRAPAGVSCCCRCGRGRR